MVAIKMEGGLRTNSEKKISSQKDNPLISIITVVYNGEEFLEDTIQSVLNQDYDNIEYIIIDGGSTDGTVDIIKKYESQIDYWISEPDNGIYDAMNKGILLSSGSLIGIINSDDYYLAGAISIVIEKFKIFGGHIFYGEMNMIERKTGRFLKRRYTCDWKLYFRMTLNHPSTFVSRKLYHEFLYPMEFKIAGDYYFFLKAKLKSKKFIYIDSVLTHMREDGMSRVDQDATRLEAKQVRKVLLGHLFFVFSELAIFLKNMINKK